MTSEPPEWIGEALSAPRFAPYLARADGDADVAIKLYWWNVEVSAAFYVPLHCLELALRNSMHRQLVIRYDRVDWWTVAPLDEYGQRMASAAVQKVIRRGSRRSAPDHVVAELPLGFWVSLVSRGMSYDRALWVPTLHKAFPQYRGRRAPLHDSLYSMVLFRNRIMHHEPIHHRDLRADHLKICRLIGYISSSMARELTVVDRVSSVLDRRREIFRSGR